MCLSPQHSGKPKEEDRKFEPSVGQLRKTLLQIKIERTGDLAWCKGPGLNPQYHTKKRRNRRRCGLQVTGCLISSFTWHMATW